MKILMPTLAVFMLLVSACSADQQTSIMTPVPSPTFTVTPSYTPTLTPTITVTPTATLYPHPMSIPIMRTGEYPGSEIVIVDELERGLNYRRYYAYYLSEGLKIYALLTIPNAEPPAGGFPAIVFNHGYIPPNVYRTTERYIRYVDELAKSGYVVFRIDYRGHDASQGDATGAYGHPGYQIDVMNAISSIQKQPQVNPKKIGLWGHSMGGYLTLRAMVISKDVKAGVIWAGVIASYPDLLYNWRRTGPTPVPNSHGVNWRSSWVNEFGAPEENPAFWNSVSATSYLGDLSGALQLHHGDADEDVPYEFSIRLAELARAQNEPVELYLYEGDNHNISNNFDIAMKRTVDFFDLILKTPE